MARIRHIALTTENPSKTAAFYKEAFGLKEVRRSPNGAVFLTDGHINLAVLNLKDNRSADVGAHGENFTGIHHFGFEVEDLDGAVQQLEIANANAAHRQGPRRQDDGGGRPRQFRDEMVGARTAS